MRPVGSTPHSTLRGFPIIIYLMCAICGFVYKEQSRPVDLEQVIRMRDSMVYRGPDDAGIYSNPGVALGSRRLAILDLSERGHMPMSTRDRRYWIVYNGEVYNFRELRDELKNKGYVFTSDTDTEVVLNGYAEEGPEILNKLDGMFAIAIWDTKERKLFLARDHIGIKPLYYTDGEEALYFASEQKALFAAGVPLKLDPHMWEELLCFGYVSGERTPFEGVKRLLAGHYLMWQGGETRITRWWNLSERSNALQTEIPKDISGWFRQAFDKSVNYRRISDVPVGILLSGGLDSTSVAASLSSQIESKISSFTVRFPERGYDESEIAKVVAKKWGIRYHDLHLRPKDLLRKVEQSSWFNDEPLLHASTPHLLAISEFAKPQVTVLLSGEGSDEILGGYDRYHLLSYPGLLAAAKFLPQFTTGISYRLKKLKTFSGLGDLERVVFYNSCEIYPNELAALGAAPGKEIPFREKILKEARTAYPGDLFRQSMYYDQHTFLQSILDRNDRMTMGASIECRVPFLDSKLMEMAGALKTSTLFAHQQGKHVLRQAMGNRLPEAVLRHKKWGFGVPWSQYLRTEPSVRQRLRESLDQDPFGGEIPIDKKMIRETVDNFLKGDTRHEKLVCRVFMVSVWHDVYVRKVPALTKAHVRL